MSTATSRLASLTLGAQTVLGLIQQQTVEFLLVHPSQVLATIEHPSFCSCISFELIFASLNVLVDGALPQDNIIDRLSC